MRRSFLMVMVLCLLLSASAFAAAPNQYDPFAPNFLADPDEWANDVDGNADVYMWLGESWGSQEEYWGQDEARSFNSGYAGHDCNKRWQIFEFTHEADLAQWMIWEMSNTHKAWRIRKPGIYASEIGTFKLQSNDDVDISFDSFGDLIDAENGGYIATFYGFSAGAVNGVGNVPETFYRADDLNSTLVQLLYADINRGSAPPPSDEGENVANGERGGFHANPDFVVTLWTKLIIEDGQGDAEATRAGFYSNTGTITISMASVKPEWLDDTGVWTK
jgi:hypothetical protein